MASYPNRIRATTGSFAVIGVLSQRRDPAGTILSIIIFTGLFLSPAMLDAGVGPYWVSKFGLNDTRYSVKY